MEKKWKPVPDVEALRYKGTPEKPDIKILFLTESTWIARRLTILCISLYVVVQCMTSARISQCLAMIREIISLRNG